MIETIITESDASDMLTPLGEVSVEHRAAFGVPSKTGPWIMAWAADSDQDCCKKQKPPGPINWVLGVPAGAVGIEIRYYVLNPPQLSLGSIDYGPGGAGYLTGGDTVSFGPHGGGSGGYWFNQPYIAPQWQMTTQPSFIFFIGSTIYQGTSPPRHMPDVPMDTANSGAVTDAEIQTALGAVYQQAYQDITGT